jgi:hypothetical protein
MVKRRPWRWRRIDFTLSLKTLSKIVHGGKK